jgi:hypothetical protein
MLTVDLLTTYFYFSYALICAGALDGGAASSECCPAFSLMLLDFVSHSSLTHQVGFLTLLLMSKNLSLCHNGNIFGGNYNLCENLCTTAKRSSKNSPKNHTCRWYDDTQPCKYVVQTRLRLWDIKITNLQTKSSWNKIFYKVMYHHIIYICDFFVEFRWLLCCGLHMFSRRLWFLLDMFSFSIYYLLLRYSEVHIILSLKI